MARPREFDEDAALSRAMHVFWTKGLVATSLADLTDAMGLSRSSLYAAFRDKETLFERALERYMRDISAERVRIVRDAASVREGVRDYFEHHIRVALDPRTPPGCLFVNTALEMDALPPRLAEVLQARARAGEAAVRALLERGQASGEIPASKDARALGSLIVAVSYGIHVMARMNPDRKKLQAIASTALEALS
jgi:TetR/AcrR family transcriptional regulator, transcriptional repressor for nem operon